MGDWIEVATQLGFPLALLILAYLTGGWVERRHYASIRERELRWRGVPVINFRNIPTGWKVDDSALVMDNVVISVDYFKRFVAGLRMLFGGRISSYETLLDRCRREALVRLKTHAVERGFHAVINVRLETSRLANGRGKNGIAGIEVLAFGTAVKLRNRPV